VSEPSDPLGSSGVFFSSELFEGDAKKMEIQRILDGLKDEEKETLKRALQIMAPKDDKPVEFDW